MPATRSFLVSPVGCGISFETNSDEAFELLDRYVFPSLSRETVNPGRTQFSIGVYESKAGFGLHVDQSLIASADRPEKLLRQLIDCLDTGLVQRLKDLHAVHAGAVLVGDQALLFPGSSHSGKSSLVAEFLRRGAICLSDEYALIDPEGRVHAYPRVLLVRDGGPAQTPILPEDCNANSYVASAAARVAAIFALRYEGPKGWDVASVPQSEALMSLLQNTPHILTERPQMVDPFNRAVAGARCYAGTRGEAADAVERVLQTVSREQG